MCDARLGRPKIVNGSVVTITMSDGTSKVTMYVQRRFNWFQKKMLRWRFGFHIEDYSDEEV